MEAFSSKVTGYYCFAQSRKVCQMMGFDWPRRPNHAIQCLSIRVHEYSTTLNRVYKRCDNKTVNKCYCKNAELKLFL